MPSPKVRAKRLRDTLTEAEEVELVLGPEPGHPSLFASAAERADARALLARIQEERDGLSALLARYPVDRERHRRHEAHRDTAPRDPDHPAVSRLDLCPICRHD
jgi:hypothetical protein